MPKGYAIFTEDIKDEAGMNDYAGKAFPTVVQYGGSALVAQDNPEVIEGTWHGTRTVILEFESVDKAREWYNSPEYQAVVGIRHGAADGNAVIVGGFG